MWIISDSLTNLFLNIRLFFLIKFNSKTFKNINNKEKKGWKLSFNDEFDGDSLDTDKWSTKSYNGSRFHEGNIINNNSAPTQYFCDNCFEFKDSIMRQIAINDKIEVNYTDLDGKNWGNWTIPYQVGQIDSSKSFKQKYGYFEIRSKITPEPGSWPAF